MISYGQRTRDYFPNLVFVIVINIKNDSWCTNKEKASHVVWFPEVPESTFSILLSIRNFGLWPKSMPQWRNLYLPRWRIQMYMFTRIHRWSLRNRFDKQCFILTWKSIKEALIIVPVTYSRVMVSRSTSFKDITTDVHWDLLNSLI